MESFEEAIQRAVLELQVNQNPKNATEQEEFIANLTRQALRQSRVLWLRQRRHETEVEISRLNERVYHLHNLYQQWDELFGRPRGPVLSELEVQLDRLRSYRDTLYAGELAWREAARLTQAAATLAAAGRDSWYSLNNTMNVVTRIRGASDCRRAIHEAVLCVQTAQSSLPGVMFPFCTMRELSALLQLIEYMYTDLQIWERYEHALDVYTSFQSRARLLSNWVRQPRVQSAPTYVDSLGSIALAYGMERMAGEDGMEWESAKLELLGSPTEGCMPADIEKMEDTIRKDVVDVDQRIFELASRLSSERANVIRNELADKSAGSDRWRVPGNRAVMQAPNNTPDKVTEQALKSLENALLWK